MAKKKILIADDEKMILKVIESRLKANRYDVVTAEDGEEALAKIFKVRPDLIILDLAMPKKNGYQVSSEVRKHPETAHIPIVILSAWVRDKAGENTALADVYVTKPFEAEHLLEVIRKLLDNPNSEFRPNVT